MSIHRLMELEHLDNLDAQQKKELRWLQSKRASFLWEARRLASVQHPFMVRLLAPPMATSTELALFLEFCEGGDLEHAIADPNHAAHRTATQWKLLLQLAAAVDSIHAQVGGVL